MSSHKCKLGLDCPSDTTSITKRQPRSPAHAYTAGRITHTKSTDDTTSKLWVAFEIIACTLVIYAVYLVYGILNEKITQTSYGEGEHAEKFTHSMFLSTVQCLGNSVWAIILITFEAIRRSAKASPVPPKISPSSPSSPSHQSQLAYEEPTTTLGHVSNLIFDNVPKHQYGLIAFSYSVSMFASMSALKYISYLIQALAKSSKLIPVMLGKILRGHRYSMREYLHVLCITGGIALFMFDQSKTSKTETSIIGIALFSLSLLMDAVTGPTQDLVNEKYKPTVMSMTFWINLLPGIVFFLISFFSGEFKAGLDFCSRHPEIKVEIITYCVLAAVGQSVILWALFKFNSMTVTIITTTRKFFTILVSVFWFGHTLQVLQWVGVLLVFIGIGADSHLKYNRKSQPTPSPEATKPTKSD